MCNMSDVDYNAERMRVEDGEQWKCGVVHELIFHRSTLTNAFLSAQYRLSMP